ncbi:hypothetical protein SAMN05443635_102172 [Roseobacter denitrificans OCh 114]|nr:hypothetical protein SAMN05443635_102172 [Roseobacter denitrificans OCh 114]
MSKSAHIGRTILRPVFRCGAARIVAALSNLSASCRRALVQHAWPETQAQHLPVRHRLTGKTHAVTGRHAIIEYCSADVHPGYGSNEAVRRQDDGSTEMRSTLKRGCPSFGDGLCSGMLADKSGAGKGGAKPGLAPKPHDGSSRVGSLQIPSLQIQFLQNSTLQSACWPFANRVTPA